MDLLLIKQDPPTQEDAKGDIRRAIQDGCWVHPTTFIDLRVPALGLVAVQHPSVFDGATTYQPCLPLESIPQGSIRLSRWMTGHVPESIEKVRVEGISVDEPLAKVAKLVVVPIAMESDTASDGLSEWIRSTNATNTELISQGKRSRQWISRLLAQNLRNQIVSTGSVFQAKIKGQQRFFRVKEVLFTHEAEEIHASRGVMLKESIVEIGQQESPTCANKGQAVLGGMDDLVKEICTFIAESFSRVDAYMRLGIPNKKAVVVSGVAGSGKKTLIRACCQKMKLREFPLSLARALSNTEIMESDQAAALSYVRAVFDMALQSAPSAVVLQDLDIIAKDQGVDSQLQSTAVSMITKEIERARLGKDVFVFAVTRNRAKLPEIFTRQELFQHEFQIPIPVKAQRQHILESLIESVEGNNNGAPNTLELAQRAAQMTSGYVAKDLRNMYRSALLHSLREDRRPKTDTEQQDKEQLGSACWDDFAYAIETSKPSQQIEFESFSSQRPLGVFGGYRDLKRRVHQAINWPVTNPETFKRIGVRPPMGLLLYGPSGCGKTMLVQTLATESNMNFIPIKGPEIFSKYLGETEATLRRLFAMARQIAPCILFFDEMDSIGAKRGWGGDGDGAGTNGVNERVLSTLLNEMDGVEERTGVFVIGCTNQPRAIDDALLRPGRLDQLIYVGYPSLIDREEIIATIGERIPLPRDEESRRLLAKKTVGFSPADLDALFREAAILSLRRSIDADSVTMEDIEVMIEKMFISVQDRIDKRKPEERSSAESDVIVPSLYREFQQER
ncbi:spermatogenesis associated protein 5 [Linnemannia zychae]|nr:spermatogenesis associated protein 5 [Linnemannia zychae]